jgi:hypothetical protein
MKTPDSWGALSPTYRAIVVKQYFERYITVTGMLTGFQAFVLTMDTIENTDYLPMFFMAISFLGNLMICFVSMVTCNVLSGGYYTPCFDHVSVACMYTLACTNALFLTSIMWSSHITFIESNLVTDNVYVYTQFLYYVGAFVCSVFTGLYLLTNENNARYSTDKETRELLIDALK